MPIFRMLMPVQALIKILWISFVSARAVLSTRCEASTSHFCNPDFYWWSRQESEETVRMFTGAGGSIEQTTLPARWRMVSRWKSASCQPFSAIQSVITFFSFSLTPQFTNIRYPDNNVFVTGIATNLSKGCPSVSASSAGLSSRQPRHSRKADRNSRFMPREATVPSNPISNTSFRLHCSHRPNFSIMLFYKMISSSISASRLIRNMPWQTRWLPLIPNGKCIDPYKAQPCDRFLSGRKSTRHLLSGSTFHFHQSLAFFLPVW